jgi:hypothetical protein
LIRFACVHIPHCRQQSTVHDILRPVHRFHRMLGLCASIRDLTAS